MRVLGAILGGGQSRRFGADKAHVLIDGVPMLERVAAGLRPQCDDLVCVGRDWPGLARIDDLPESGLGPLGGIAGALDHAAVHGFDSVMCSPCDMPDVPHDLVARLSPGPSYILGQQAWSLWPVRLASPLRQWLATGQSRRLRDWAATVDARPVMLDRPVRNINTPADI